MPQDDEKDRDESAVGARVDRVLSGMKGANMPDILKVQSSASKGEKYAAYKGSAPLAPKAGDDTQKVEDAVIVDQTQQDGIDASEVQKLARERRERISRDATTSVIEIAPLPKKSALPLVVFLAVFFVGAVALIVKMQHDSEPDAAIAPASAAAIAQPQQRDDTQIPPVPTSVTTATQAVTSAAPQTTTNVAPPSTGAAQAVATASNPTSSASAHAAPHPSASASDDDPDKALFKTHRTP